MAKILLIEPYKILRQAIALALFPEHDVQAEGDIAKVGVGSIKDCDLLIVDGEALKESNQLTSEVNRVIQGSKIPTIWLEGAESTQPPKLAKREKLLVINKPIEGPAFQSAVASLLSSDSSPKVRSASQSSLSDQAKQPEMTAKKGREETTRKESLGFIDLIDVVEELPQSKQGKKAPGKRK